MKMEHHINMMDIWSWTYFDNNECYDENGVNLWQWMSVQTKADKVIASGSQKAYIIGDDWGLQ